MRTPLVPALAQLSPVTRARITEHAAAGPTLVTVASPTHIQGPAAAHAAILDSHPAHTVTESYPAGARWKTDEIQTAVIDPVRYASDTHRHLVIADAHAAPQAVHDRLLKTLEELRTNATVWLVHPTTQTLPATLRGRAAAHVILQGGDPRAALDALVAAGVSDDDATRMLREASGDLTLAHAAASFGLAERLTGYAVGFHTTTPTLTAGRVLLSAAHLAVAVHHQVKRPPAAPVQSKGSLPVADLNKLNPQARSTLRRLVSAKVTAWKTEATVQLGDVDDIAARALGSRLRLLAELEETLTFNTPLMTVLASTLATLNR